jgi:hypothetical protein
MMRTELVPTGHHVKSGQGTRRIVWALCLIVFSLCRATAAPKQDQATLYFFNTSGWSVGTRNQTLLDNEKKIVDLDREKYVVLTIAPGHHVLRLKYDPSKKHLVDLDATPGTTYYVAGGYHPRMPAILSTWSFAEIPKDEADKFLAEMKPQTQK